MSILPSGFNIAMENGPFIIYIDDLPIKNGGSFHGYVSHNQNMTSFVIYV